MTEQQIPKFAGTLVEHQAHFASLSVEDGQWVIQNTAAAIDLFVKAVSNREMLTPLFNPIGTVIIPATSERFVARDRFVVYTSHEERMRIFSMGSSFKELFLDKIEEPHAEATLLYQESPDIYSDEAVIREIGGEKKAETTLTEIYAMLEHGENGDMLIDGGVNIFYVRDIKGVLRTVRICQLENGWNVDAYHDKRSRVLCFNNHRVFFHN